jgi:hypothetical protein
MTSTPVVDGVARSWTGSASAVSCRSVAGRRTGEPATLLDLGADSTAGDGATCAPLDPLDLSGWSELRFWSVGEARAEGTAAAPFRFELGYRDAADVLGEDHRWLVPVGRPGRWEEHRIGLDGDRRSAVTTLFVQATTDGAVRLTVSPVLAVDERPIADAEAALTERIEARAGRPGPSCPTAVDAASGGTALVTALQRRLRAGNRLLVADGAAPFHVDVTGAAHDDATGRTTVQLANPLPRAVTTGTTVTVVAPVVWEEPAALTASPPGPRPDPVILAIPTGQREDAARGWSVPQRDSFRRRGSLTVCSVRRPPLPLSLEYQLLVATVDADQRAAVLAGLLGALYTGASLPVDGGELAVTRLPAPPRGPDRAPLAPLLVQVDTRLETGPRVEVPWVQNGAVHSGQFEPTAEGGYRRPAAGDGLDDETIVIQP